MPSPRYQFAVPALTFARTVSWTASLPFHRLSTCLDISSRGASRGFRDCLSKHTVSDDSCPLMSADRGAVKCSYRFALGFLLQCRQTGQPPGASTSRDPSADTDPRAPSNLQEQPPKCDKSRSERRGTFTSRLVNPLPVLSRTYFPSRYQKLANLATAS